MNFTTTRRALTGLLAALFVDPPVTHADGRPPGLDIEAMLFGPDEAAPIATPKPATIPGLNQITEVRAVVTIATEDGRMGVLHLELAPDVPVRFHHMGGFDGEIPVPGNSLASFPNWFQREVGYAALGAVPAMDEEGMPS
jgi:hypothetical protein